MTYLGLLRGINVGGKAKIKMADLRLLMTRSGFTNVATYIQSGNVVFNSDVSDTDKLADTIHAAIFADLGLDIDVVVLEKTDWAAILKNAPVWWGADDTWKHNLLVLLPPYDMPETMHAIGKLKPEIEAAEPGERVVYQSMSREFFGRTTTGKLASSPLYKKITVRNYNTAHKLQALLDTI